MDFKGELIAVVVAKEKLVDFIACGEKIGREEYHPANDGMIEYIAGPKYDQWSDELKIFNSHVLINHPLHDKLENLCDNHNNIFGAHRQIMSLLKTVEADDEFWNDLNSGEVNEMGESEKPRKVFISHSSKDKEYMIVFVELLEDIGMPDGSIVCSSVPGHGIPGGAKTFEWLREQFLQCNLRVIFALSHNYYDSAASLNEMGAAWLTKATDSLLLLPEFDFNDIKGCVDSTEIGIKLDGAEDELKHRLGELKDTLVSEYSLPVLSSSRWERHRDEFVRKVQEIAQRRGAQQEIESGMVVTETRTMGIVTSGKFPDHVPTDAAFLLVYAAEGDGQIIKISTLGDGTSVSANGKQFMANSSQRESARWVEALDFLISQVWVKSTGHKGQVFELTGTGYNVADYLKENMCIDTSKEPLEELKEFE